MAATTRMGEQSRVSGPATARSPRRSDRRTNPEQMGMSIGRLFGIEVRLDWSLLVVVVLITVNLGAGLFPAMHPEWSPATPWLTAIIAALAFLASVLAHELAHALVGRRQGIQVEGITLFIFGGMARVRDEPKSPRAELVMAIVGPLTSLAIGVLALVLASAAIGASASTPAELEAITRLLGPASTLLLWLGPINILLAVFNLIPAFPLDGGRVLRAILWRATGDLDQATRWATRLGRAFGLFLVFLGVWMLFGHQVPLLGGGLVQGLWTMIIGWFLSAAAIQSYEQLRLRRVVAGIPVSRLMRPLVGAVDSDSSVQALAERFLRSPSDRCLPVVHDGRFLGVACMSDLSKIPRDEWDQRTVAEVMTPAEALVATTPDEDMTQALRKLAQQDFDQLPVVDKGEVRGLLRRADILRWMELQGMPA